MGRKGEDERKGMKEEKTSTLEIEFLVFLQVVVSFSFFKEFVTKYIVLLLELIGRKELLVSTKVNLMKFMV